MSGLTCPKCGSTFRAGFVRCHGCKVDLVDAAIYAESQAALGDPKKLLANKTVVAIVHAGLPACREIERALLDAKVLCYIDAAAEEGEPLAPGALKVGVFIAEEDMKRAGAVMKSRFETLVAKEGVGSFKTDAIDLSLDEVECPACSFKGALKDGACGDCGLFLGAPPG
ncbi:MAG: hypothetical protein Q8O67_20255 [Deltaproteobacteria bacterium]|nr:hypothetical protein [Deltaproteobacteria bacterium]